MSSYPAFSRENWDAENHPILLSVPHAGRHYPEILLKNLRLPPEKLIRLEDRYADLLVRGAVKQGFPTIIAHRARAWMDLNRADTDLDRGMLSNIPHDAKFEVSAKQRGGLGLVPRRLNQEGDIWKGPFEYSDVKNRISEFHAAYHGRISDKVIKIREKFGIAILLDVHSMPPLPDYQDQSTQFVIGDRFGGSSASLFSEILQEQVKQRGYRCGLNYPYSGDYMLRRHGNPSRNIHAIQLETDKSLYLDGNLNEPTEMLGKIAELVQNLAQSLANAALDSGPSLLAAE